MKIYTKTGDKGETGLWGGDRVPKSHPRVEAYGDVDELNSGIGCASACLPEESDWRPLREALARVQEELFMIGALLATPASKLDRLASPFDRGLPPGAVSRLEAEIDSLTADLRPMTHFILPGGGPPGAWLHLARTVCRRAERRVVEFGAREKLPDGIVVYLNRLSDYLFTAARWANAKQGREEISWQGLAKR